MTAPLVVVREPDHTPARQVFAQRLHDPAAGRLAIEVVPTPAAHTPELLASELLIALGKNLDLPSSYPNQNIRWARICAWLIASGIDTVVVGGAQLLHLRAWSRLFEIACVCDLTVWVISRRATTPRTQRRWLAQWPADVIEWAEFETTWKHAAKRKPRPRGAARQPSLFPHVPATDFVGFLDDAEAILLANDYARVREVTLQYAREFMAFLHAKASTVDEEQVAARLLSYIHDADGADEAVTRLRGAQIGAYHANWSLKVDYPALHARLTGNAPPELTVDHAARLRAFASTFHAALGAVALITGAQTDQLAAVRLNDLSDDAGTIVVADRRFEIPAHARDLLDSHRLVRHITGARRDEQFFASSRPDFKPGAFHLRWHLRAIRQATGIALQPKYGAGPRFAAKRWSQRYGISFQPLDKPNNPSGIKGRRPLAAA